MADTELLVLSLWQPWATLVVVPDPVKGGTAAPKEFETRAWRPRLPVPFRVAIHATQKLDKENLPLLSTWPFKVCLERCGFYAGDPRPFTKRGILAPRNLKPLPLGAIVGVATVASLHKTDHPEAVLGSDESDYEEYKLGDWSPGRFAWHLEDAAMLSEPIPFWGRQDVLYPLHREGLAQINAQLAASSTPLAVGISAGGVDASGDASPESPRMSSREAGGVRGGVR